MPRKKKKSVRAVKVSNRDRKRASRNAKTSPDTNCNPSGLLSGYGDPAPSRGKSLNALRLAPPQGSLPTQAKGIPPWSDSLPSVCAPVSAPSPKSEAGQTQLADSLPSVCTQDRVPSPMSDAVRMMKIKDAKIQNNVNERNQKTIEHVIKNKNQTKDLSKQFSVEDSIDGNNSYQATHRMRVIQGSFHQGNSIFGSNAGKQCVANTLSCIAYAHIHPVENWKSEDIDVILYNGNELYSYLQRSSAVQNEYLLVTELPKDLDIYETSLKFDYDHSLVGLLRDSLNDDVLDNDMEKLDLPLNAALLKIFSSHKHCFISFGGNTFAAFCIDNMYYVFDSHARSQDGSACPHGKATMICYDNLQDIVTHCYTLSKSLGIPHGIQFEITAVISKRSSHVSCINNIVTDSGSCFAKNEKTAGSSDDVVFSGSEFVPHKFCPLVNEMKCRAIEKLKLLSRKSCRFCTFLINEIDLQFDRSVLISKNATKPCDVHKIKGDGNCFFRAVSYAIFASEEHHSCLRHMTCDFLQQNPDFILMQTSDYNSCFEYLQKSQMCSTGTWATAIEIIAMSAILKFSIYIYSNNKWLKYSTEGNESDHGIYLYHANENHYDVVLDVMDAPEFVEQSCNSNCINTRNKEAEHNEKEESTPKDRNIPNIDNLMEKYFCHQQEQHALKKKSRENQSRKLYMQSYMKKWRENRKYNADVLKQDKLRKQKMRQDKILRASEHLKDNASKKKVGMDFSRSNFKGKKKDRERKSLIQGMEATREKEEKRDREAKSNVRQDSTYREIENKREKTRKAAIRQNEAYRSKERKRDQVAKTKARQVNDYRILEREREKSGKINSRQNEAFRSVERKRDQEARSKVRQHNDYRILERGREKLGKTSSRQNEAYRLVERKRDNEARSKVRQSINYRVLEREREKDGKSEARQNEAYRSEEKKRDKEARTEARKNEIYRMKERERETVSKLISRQDVSFRTVEKLNDRNARSEARKNMAYTLKERQTGTLSKQKSRLCHENQILEKERDADRKRKLRQDISYRENERLRKCAKRNDNISREIEKKAEKISKAEKRKNVVYVEKEKERTKKRRYGKDLQECIAKFKNKIAEGPVYTCTCCHQTWFSHSVSNAKNMHEKCKFGKLQMCFTSFISEKNTEWICCTCKNSLHEGRIPKLAVVNKMGFPRRPPELNLHQLEERLVALRIPFMQIRELPRGGQLSIKGNVVNVPVEVQPTVNSLPRPFNENVTVSVRLKKKLSYKSCDLTENARPLHVISALHWLMNHSELYKSSGIKIDDDWVSRISMASQEIVNEYLQSSTDNVNKGCHDNNVGDPLDKIDQTQSETDCERFDDAVVENDEFIEIDERETNSGNCDTIIDDANIIQENMYTFAPGEGQKPLGLYSDPDAEYLSFPSIFCGQRRPDNKERMVNVHYSDIVKWELRSVDRRASQNVPNIFFKMKKIQMKQISDKVNLVLRRCKTEGKKLTAKDVLDPVKTKNLAQLDEGYYIFRSLRNSPPYLEGKKKDLFAMIRQLGLPTWFVSLSAADTRWTDQLSMLSQLNSGRKLSEDDIDKISWAEKTNLVKKILSKVYDISLTGFTNFYVRC